MASSKTISGRPEDVLATKIFSGQSGDISATKISISRRERIFVLDMWRKVKDFLGRRSQAWDKHVSQLFASWLKYLKEAGDAYHWRAEEKAQFCAEVKSVPPESREKFKKTFDLLVRLERTERIIALENELRCRSRMLKDFWRDGVPVCPVGKDDGCESCLRFRQQDAMCAKRDIETRARNETRHAKLLFCMRQGLCPEYVRVENAVELKDLLQLPELPWIAVASQRQKDDVIQAAKTLLRPQADLLLLDLHMIMLLSTSAIRLRERLFGRDSCIYVVMRELKHGPRDWDGDIDGDVDGTVDGDGNDDDALHDFLAGE